MSDLHCYLAELLPVPGSPAKAVRYPVCEWRGAGHTRDAAMHPLNRFVCSWLTSDMADLSRCDDVLQAITQLEAGAYPAWYVDGDAFNVTMQVSGVQFNASHVGPDDAGYWNSAEGRFTLADIKNSLHTWRDFLLLSPSD